MATWKILTVYYIEDGACRSQNFSSNGAYVYPENSRDGADTQTWPPINRIYRIVYYPLAQPGPKPADPLLVLDVVESRLTFAGDDGIDIVAWIYAPLAKNYTVARSARTVRWQTKTRRGARADFATIKLWDGLDLTKNVPALAPGAVWSDSLFRFLNGNRQAQGSVLRVGSNIPFNYPYSQTLGFPSFYLEGFNLSDDLKAVKLDVPAECAGFWTTRVFFVKAATLMDDRGRSYFVAVLRLESPAGQCGSHKTGFTAFDAKDYISFESSGWTLVQRPASTISADAGSLDSPPSQDSVLHIFNVAGSSVAEIWNNWAREYHHALAAVSGGQSASFLPTFTDASGESSQWVMTYRVTAFLDDFDLSNNGGWVNRRQGGNQFYAGDYADSAGRPPAGGVVFQPLSMHLQHPESQDDARIGRLALERVFDVFGNSISQIDLQPMSTAPRASKAGLEGLIQAESIYGIVVKYTAAATIAGDPPPTAVVRMGSLDLALGGNRGGNTSNSTDTNWMILRREQGVPCVHLDAKFVVSEILPGGQDDPAGEEYVPENSYAFGANPCAVKFLGGTDPASTLDGKIDAGFRRKRPLVIHIDDVKNKDGLYTLQIVEEVAPEKNRTVQLTVYSQNANQPGNDKTDLCDRPGLRRAFILDRNPFLVAEVLYTPFEGVGNSASSIIAVWDNTKAQGAAWMLQFNQDPFCLVMPPQAVGEEMVKGQLPDRPDPGNRALPFRFSGDIRLTVDPRKDPRKQITSFSEAPWNLRRILGTPQDPQPGPLVNRMQYELLYGLSCDATQPAFRLADLIARVGQIPPRRREKTVWTATSTQSAAYDSARLEWADVYRRYLSRIAVLEPWNNIINSTTTSVSLKDGLSCIIRPTAELANPITPEPDRLRGGVTWGIESKNVYDQVTTNNPFKDKNGNPQTTAASLESFSISSLGGWGKQNAEFLKGLTKVYADVEMGRTSTYKLDRLGRIAGWWVLAKHVIVYQRSVTPSRQFFKEQPKYAGWPVPRKVEEYVEILEDARPFPDNLVSTDPTQLAAARQACGPVKSILLKKGMRFNVDSAWGSDVTRPEATGWKIPLWTPGAWPPDVYPKPAIAIGTAVADGTSGVKQPPVCDNPENLVFFTLTGLMKNGTLSGDVDPDPHNWPPVMDIDLVNALPPVPPKDFANADLRQTAPTPSTTPAAYGPCTFRLRPGASPTNLVADRAQSKQMAVVLESITVMRGIAGDASTLPAPAAAVQQVQNDAANLYASLLRALPRDSTVGLNQQVWQDLKNAATAPADTAKKTVTAAAQKITDVTKKITTDATDFEQGLRDNFKSALETKRDKVLSDYTNYVSSRNAGNFNVAEARLFLQTTQRNFEEALLFPSSTPGSLASTVAHYADAAMAIKKTVEGALAVFSAALANWQATGAAAVRDLNNALLKAVETADALKTLPRPLASLPDLYAWASSQLGEILSDVDTARKTFITNLEALGPADATGARQELDKFKATVFYTAIAAGLPDKIKALVNASLPANQTVATVDDIYKALHQVDVWVHGYPKDSPIANTGQLAVWAQQCQTLTNGLSTLQDLQNSVAPIQNYLQVTLPAAVTALFTDTETHAKAIAALFGQEMDLMKARLNQSVDDLTKKLADAVNNVVQPGINTINDLRRDLENKRDDLSRQAEAYLDKSFRQLTDSAAYQVADSTFRLIRAFGAPPQVPNLAFDRDKIAYFFQQVDPQVNLTPVLAHVAQAGAAFDTLKTLGATLPTLGALDQLIPTSISGFGLSDIFGNFAGLNLANLFPGLKIPSLDTNKAVKITHDFDPQTLRATMNADINFTIADTSTLFTIGPVSVQVLSATFAAKASLAGDRTGIVRRTASGTISGNWQLSLSGAPFVTLKSTDLNFDDAGSIKFSVKPQNVELPGALKVVTELLNKFVSPDSGLTFGMLKDGFQAILALPVPDIQGVTSGFSNLKLGALFTIEIADSFTMGVGFSLASKEAPFSLTIFVLGGGGYVSVRANYTPMTQKLGCQVDMAVTASASLAISLAVISGGVYVYFGATASYNTDGQGLTFGVMFLIRGEVSVLGIVSASISLLLEATYGGGTLTGRGQLSLKIQICWCFTLEVNEEVTYTLGHGGQSNAAIPLRPGPLLAAGPQAVATGIPEDVFDTFAGDYVRMLV